MESVCAKWPISLFTTVAILACIGATGHCQPSTPSEHSCYSSFDYLLEKTMLKVDVLKLHISLDSTTGHAVARLIEGQKRSSDLEQALVAQYLQARQADVDLSFLMSISHHRFVESARKTTRRLARQGFISDDAAVLVGDGMAQRFAFLKGAGIQEGDRLYYTVRSDSVRTCFVSAIGDTLLNDVRIGPERRVALLGSYFAPKTNFHDGLLDLVFEGCE